MCIAFFPCHLRSVGREELFACLAESLCVLIVRVPAFFLYQSVMVSFDSLSFSVRLRGRFVGLAIFFLQLASVVLSEFMANGRVLLMFGAVDSLFSPMGSCTHRQVHVIFRVQLCGVGVFCWV